MYQAKDGATMLDAQELDPRLTSLENATATNAALLKEHTMDLLTQNGRLNAIDNTLTDHKVRYEANTKSIEGLALADAELAKVVSSSQEGLDIYSGSEIEGAGHVRIFANEIDLNGAVQVLDDEGTLVNINTLPATVKRLDTDTTQALNRLDSSIASILEELRDLRSRCRDAYEWELMPHTATSDRICRRLTEVSQSQRYCRGMRHLFNYMISYLTE
jgi:hypothetical protein